MPIVVNSPFSGQPVKIRDQDIDRAVRDEENRIFYVLPLSNGTGYFGSTTRQGGEKEERRYLEMAQKSAQMKVVGDARSEKQVHNAMGKKRGGKRRLVVTVIVLAIIAAAVWFVMKGDSLPSVDELGEFNNVPGEQVDPPQDIDAMPQR